MTCGNGSNAPPDETPDRHALALSTYDAFAKRMRDKGQIVGDGYSILGDKQAVAVLGSCLKHVLSAFLQSDPQGYARFQQVNHEIIHDDNLGKFPTEITRQDLDMSEREFIVILSTATARAMEQVPSQVLEALMGVFTAEALMEVFTAMRDATEGDP